MRRTIHPRRRIGPVNPIEETASTSRSDFLESMGEVVDATKDGSLTKVTLRVVLALSPGVCASPGWTEIRICDCDLAFGKKI